MTAPVKAIWVVRDQLINKERIDRCVEVLAQQKYDVAIVQVRGRGETYYPSEIDPPAHDLEAPFSELDPLGYFLEKAGAAGIETHAWVNATFTWSEPELHPDPKHVVNAHPEWLMRDRKGDTAHAYPQDIWSDMMIEGVYLCPSIDPAMEYLASMYREVLDKYPALAGVHFDFIRFPGGNYYCFCENCRKLFKEHSGVNPLDIKEDDEEMKLKFDDWRRNLISDIVRRVNKVVKAAHPDKKISAAVFPNKQKAKDIVLQDWGTWLEEGLLDILCPMNYAVDTETYSSDMKVIMDTAKACNIPVWAGIGSWRITPESSGEKIRSALDLGAEGFCLFSFAWGPHQDGEADYIPKMEKAAGL